MPRKASDDVYIGLGTVVVILLIILIIMMLRGCA